MDSWEVFKRNNPLGARAKLKHRFARDYCYAVFDRYLRRHNFLPESRAYAFLGKIEDRWQWWSDRAHLYIPSTKKQLEIKLALLYPAGLYSPVGRLGWWEDPGYNKGGPQWIDCDFCGAPVFATETAPVQPDGTPVHEPFTAYHAGNRKIARLRCSNILCQESRDFMQGTHPLLDQARQLKVRMKRPITKYRAASCEEKAVIAAYAIIQEL